VTRKSKDDERLAVHETVSAEIMKAEQFRSAIRMSPFKPFVIHTQPGEAYNVAHPEVVWQSPDGDTVVVHVGGSSVAFMDVSQVSEVVFAARPKTKREKPNGS
jgi:hypothetical protein